MTKPVLHTAFMASQILATGDDVAVAPEWVHLLPPGQVMTRDRRGPYTLAPFAEIIAASFADTDRLEIDINHASFIAAPQGGRSDAAGWIVAMQAREDGLWGRVEWTEEGAKLVTGKAYRKISPVVRHTADNKIIGLLNASLTNRPNLRGLTALHQEELPMSFMARLAKMLGLAEDATEDAIVAALESKTGGTQVAAQAQLDEIGTVLGLKPGVTTEAIVTAAQTAVSDDSTIRTALQSQVTELSTELKALQDGQRRSASEAFIDGEIRGRRMGLNSGNRAEFIAMHMENPARTEKLVQGFAVMGPSGAAITPPAADGKIALQSEQMAVAGMLGLSTEDFTAQLERERAQKEAR